MKNHLLLFLILSMSSSLSFIVVSAEPTPVKIGVILDMNSPVGKSSLVSMKIAMDDFYTAHPNYTTRIVFKTRDAQKKVISAAAAALDLIQNEKVHAIIGPQTSSEAAFVGDLGAKANVPIVSFSATCPALSPTQFPFFIRTGLSDAAQAPAIAALIQAYGWRRVVPIYEDTDYGAGFIPSLVEALLNVSVKVPYRSIVSKDSADDDLLTELYRLKSMQTRVFLVHMTASLAVKLFDQAEAAGMMDKGFVWIVSEKLTSLLPSVAHDSMQGLLGLRPYVPVSTDKYHKFHKRWRREFRREITSDDDDDDDRMKLTTFSVWAYDTVWAVAVAVEAASPLDFTRVVSAKRQTDLSAIPVSKTGKKLLHEIKMTRFTGLAGDFNLVRGELNMPAFQLMNLHGENEMKIGYWTPMAGLHRHLGKAYNGGYSATMESLRPVIWPGESTMVPKGWEMPTSGKKLKIAVPGTILPGFRSFLDVRTDSKTNQTIAGGFVIEVFESAVKRLPYALPFEYVSFKSSHGNSTGSYDDFVREVIQDFDAVVGDTTITAKRLEYVDFTLPYTLAGTSMVVPLQNKQSKNAWIFVKPLTLDLWLVSLCFFVFTGFIVWVLEHRINPEFRGPLTNQLGTIFYFTFSTLVFAHRENIVSNLGRLVVIIWVFVVLILQSSYTASLTSMLTVEQFVPSYNNINELKERGLRVGHLENSFVRGFLIKTWGFNPENLVPFRSPEKYAEALAKGSQNGGVAAIVDEIPYLKVFLKDHCDNYIMAGQTYKTGGFGFAFPKGSQLAQDLSRAILNITEGDEMSDIERRWFGDQTNCPKLGSGQLSSNSLNFMSFWGLFLITGIASFIAFCIYWIIFFYKNRNQLTSEIGPGLSLPWRLRSIGWLFDQKDMSSHTFRNAEVKDESNRGTNCPQSPLSYSTDHTFGGGTPTDELATPNSETPLHGEVTVNCS